MRGGKQIKNKKMLFLCIAVVLCAGFVVALLLYSENNQTNNAGSSLTVKCSNGIFTGALEENTGVLSFKGIPYAKAPVGELRWKAPVEPDPSDDRFNATEYGKVCLQSPSTENASGKPMSEDCLSLNIWTSDLDTQNKPVMVWIHGGSYGWGGTNDPIYNGEFLVDKYDDLIVVTINYRVNLLGFIDFSNVPGGEDYPDGPYLGILDQQMALRWIQKNIESFGGDPNNVTIFGESAGGGSVISLLAADGSDGLFNRAIAQSGAGLNHSKEKYDETNQAGELLKAAGVSDMDGLMALSEAELYDAMCADTERIGGENGTRVSDLNNYPMRDDKLSIIPSDVGRAIAERARDVDIMIGTTGDEMRYWVNEMGCGNDDDNASVFYEYVQGKVEKYKNLYPDQADRIDEAVRISTAVDDSKYTKLYPGIWKYADVMSEIAFRTPMLEILAERINAGGNGNNYVYLFNKRATVNDWYGACHACELNYVFYNLNRDDVGVGPADPKLAEKVSAAWVSFARTGNPSTDEIVWEKYNLENRPTMVMGDDCTMKMENDPKGTLRELLQDVLIF